MLNKKKKKKKIKIVWRNGGEGPTHKIWPGSRVYGRTKDAGRLHNDSGSADKVKLKT